MMFARQVLKIFALLAFTSPIFAVSVYQCEDENGDITFQDRCPPGTTQIDSREIRTGATSSTAGENTPINATLYVVPQCAPCETVREFLQIRNITVTIKDASADVAVQDELRALTGTLQAPVTTIGDQVVVGANRSELTAVLTAAGYVEPE